METEREADKLTDRQKNRQRKGEGEKLLESSSVAVAVSLLFG